MSCSIEEIRLKYHNHLSDLICRKVNHDDRCHDILQDVYIKIINNLDKIGRVNDIGPYITRIATNTVIDYHRSARKDCCPDTTEEVPTNMETMADDKNYKLANSFMKEMIDALPQIYKQALIEVEINGISQKQLAAELGISYSGLKSRVQRAKEMLRQSILDCCEYKFDSYGNVVSCCGQDCC